MHKKLINQARLELTIRPHGPVLIKGGAGDAAADPSLPDMAFVRTGEHADPYFPGSSLKGVIRSHCERIVRSLCSKQACDPLANDCCGKSNERRTYAASCFICRLFGHEHLASHVLFADAHLSAGSRPLLEIRNGVGIDRVFGSSMRGVLYQFEALTGGDFAAVITATNFSCAHLGLLLMALDDLNHDVIRIGYGKSRGLGRVDLAFQRLTLLCYSPAGDRFRGVSENDAIEFPLTDSDLFGRARRVIEQPGAEDLAVFGDAWAAQVAGWQGEAHA